VDLVWGAAASRREGTSLHEFFPDAGVHLVFRRAPGGCRAVLLGPTTERATVERAGDAEYLGVRFLAGQAPRLADLPSAALTDTSVDLEHLGGVPLPEVERRLAALPSLSARCHLLAELACREARPLVEDAACRRRARLLEAREGQLRVDELARALRLGVRSVERRFKAAFGMTPKRFTRLVRLRHVLGALGAGGHDTLAALAAERGFTDQAHLARDFKLLTGRVPGAADAARSRVLALPETRVVHRVRR